MNDHKINPLIIYPMDPAGRKIGGIETFIKNFIKYAPDDFDISFVGVSSEAEERSAITWRQIEVHSRTIDFLPLLHVRDENRRTRVPLSLNFTLALYRHRKEIDFARKIIEFHRMEPAIPLNNVPCRKLLFVHGNMVDLHNPGSEVKWRRMPSLYFSIEKKVIKGIDRVFVVRQDGVEFYRKRYPFMKERFSFLPTWVDEETFHPLERDVEITEKRKVCEEKGFPVDSRLVLFVGRLEGQKNPMLLLDTFNYVSKHLPETRLLIIGTGSLRTPMESRARSLGLLERIHFFGALSQEHVASLMRISDVFLLSSAFEGMPMSILEAQGCGLPVVSTNVGEVRNVVKNGLSGIIVNEHNPVSLGNAVIRVLNDRETFSTRNCLGAIREHTARRILKKLYQEHYALWENQ
jgi:glycosyltransferase involved in cell wall biosynthesis